MYASMWICGETGEQLCSNTNAGKQPFKYRQPSRNHKEEMQHHTREWEWERAVCCKQARGKIV